MIASFDRKGPKPQGYKAVQVTFDEGFNIDKLYVYWVPRWWHVEPGDKLTVVVTGKHKTTTVRSVHTEGFVGAAHKCAVNYKAMPRDRLESYRQKFAERIEVPAGLLTPERVHALTRQGFGFKETATGRVAVSDHPLQDNIPKENTMIEVKSVTYLNGKPFENCTDDELFAAIRKDEAEINELLKIENKPKALKDRVTKLEAGIKALVAMMDARP